MTETATNRIQALAKEVLAETEFYLVETDVRGAKGSQVVDIAIDSYEGPTLDELAELSREIGFLIDTEDLMLGSYDLNVSSPGADEPLHHPRQFKKNVGRDLFVEYHTSDDAQGKAPTLHGTLENADDERIEMAELKVSKDKRRKKSKTGRIEHIPYEDVIEARIDLPW